MSQLEVSMETDLNELNREELLAELVKIRNAVSAHRDSTMHYLCWHHPALGDLLSEKSSVRAVVPEWPVFRRGCLKYRQSLDEQLTAPHAAIRSSPAVMAPNDSFKQKPLCGSGNSGLVPSQILPL
jgi:hypothetical protein